MRRGCVLRPSRDSQVHLLNEHDDGFGYRRSMSLLLGFGLVFPHTAEHLAMPAQHRIRLDDEERFLPRAQLASQEDEQLCWLLVSSADSEGLRSRAHALIQPFLELRLAQIDRRSS